MLLSGELIAFPQPRAQGRAAKTDDHAGLTRLASGSLPPRFSGNPDQRDFLLDGGIIDNTPLGDAIGAFLRI